MNMTNERLKEIDKNIEGHLGLFSDAEMERDQKTYCTFRPRELHDTKEAIEELLQLRALRDAGDEEIRELNHNLLKRGCPSVWVCRLRDIAIARGQARIDAVNKAAEWAKESEALQKQLQSKLEHKSQQVDSQVALVSEMQTEIDAIVEENKQLKKRVEAALKAPGVEEIDALENEYLFTLKTLGHLGSLADRYSLRDLAVKLASLARRAIASRDEEKERADEVVGLLSEAKKYNLLGEMEHMALFKGDEPSVVVRVSKRILEIVEGK